MILSLMIICLEIEEGFPVFEELQYLAETFKPEDFSRKILPNCPPFKAAGQPFDKRDFEEVTITTFMASDSESASTMMDERTDRNRSKSKANQGESGSNAIDIDQVPYFSGNPSVEVTKGILHLYKINDDLSQNNMGRSDLLCMLSVPAKMSSTDLLNFISPFGKNIEHIRIIRNSTPNIYMTLLKFKNGENAHEFYDTFNGKSFNTLEPEVCHLVYVCKVESQKSSDGGCLPLEGATELPTCHICLERMDESVEGILTVLCNHSFHGSCLVKWQDSSCPVCRCLQTTEVVQENKCFSCDSKDSLWICLICGHIGCGRYNEGHAHRHFRETQHTYSMELETQRVWDYTGDNYVHRLVQNKSDGKLVEFASDEKLDSITLEYTYLLTSQLESQRLYFEEKIAFVEKDAFQQMEAVMEKSKKTLEECQKYERMFSDSEKERKGLEKKNSHCGTKLKNLEKELKDEKEMNECLRQNQQIWQEKVADLERKLKQVESQRQKEVQELQEQVGDLMRHFEAQTAIEKAPAGLQQEIQEGQMFVTQNQARGSNRHRKKHK